MGQGLSDNKVLSVPDWLHLPVQAATLAVTVPDVPAVGLDSLQKVGVVGAVVLTSPRRRGSPCSPQVSFDSDPVKSNAQTQSSNNLISVFLTDPRRLVDKCLMTLGKESLHGASARA